MALSLFTQHPSYLDLQHIFDSHSLHQHQNQNQNQNQQQQQDHQQQHHQQQRNKFDQLNFNNTTNQMEYNIQTNYQSNQNNQNNNNTNNNHINTKNSNNNNNNNTNNSNNSNNNNSNNNLQQQQQQQLLQQHHHQLNSENINQNFQDISKAYINGYHHHPHHLPTNRTDYEQVINFVDSPPNSEESWADEHSKGSPGPQIIDVQTIYSNSGTRKRRMDWDSLDIGQNGNSETAQSGELTNKTQIIEKDKQKREKLSGRGSWSDEIGFDLNAEFNSNSYLNNESFLSFSPSLTVLKQEPHTEQQIKINKNPLNSPIKVNIPKIDKPSSPSSINDVVHSPLHIKDKCKDDLKDNIICGCDSAQNSQTEFDQINHTTDSKNTSCNNNTSNSSNHSNNIINNANSNSNSNSNSSSTTTNDNSRGFNNIEKCNPRNNNSVNQQLNIIDAKKIEYSPNGVGNTNADDSKFQYILAAATSIATKNNEETLTYLNQGQSYEIKLKKIGDLTFYRDKILKSVIKICFHERRLQFMEREQMHQWQTSRPGERIIEVDVPLSYGLCHVSQPLNPSYLNTVEVFWDPLKEVGVYIKVNCISTEFTAKKHGGEKGVPFRLQIETYIENTNNININNNNNNNINNSNNNNNNNNNSNNNSNNINNSVASITSTGATTTQSGALISSVSAANTLGSAANVSQNISTNSTVNNLQVGSKQPVHAAACQIKVFKLKGADRKHKQDREKIQKRPQSEQEKFQPSYECTIMNEIPLDLVSAAPPQVCYSPEYMKIWPNSPVHIPKYDGALPYANTSPTANSSPIAINSVTSTNSPTMKLMDSNMVSPQQIVPEVDDYIMTNIMPDSTPAQVSQWLTNHRLTAYIPTFAHFSGSDIMRMSKDDLMQICGLADGIRMFNILRAKTITPRLTIYVSMDGNSYNAIYLISNTSKELMQKLFKLPGFFEMIANNSNSNGGGGGVGGSSGTTTGPALETNGTLYNNWGMHSKYSGSGSNIFNDVSKCFIYFAGPSGVHVTITDEVLNNEIKDGSLYALEVQNGKIVMKMINKNDN